MKGEIFVIIKSGGGQNIDPTKNYSTKKTGKTKKFLKGIKNIKAPTGKKAMKQMKAPMRSNLKKILKNEQERSDKAEAKFLLSSSGRLNPSEKLVLQNKVGNPEESKKILSSYKEEMKEIKEQRLEHLLYEAGDLIELGDDEKGEGEAKDMDILGDLDHPKFFETLSRLEGNYGIE